jgi:hypothetical protein
MIVMGPLRDETRLGLIDVGVPRYIFTRRLVRTRASFFAKHMVLQRRALHRPILTLTVIASAPSNQPATLKGSAITSVPI